MTDDLTPPPATTSESKVESKVESENNRWELAKFVVIIFCLFLLVAFNARVALRSERWEYRIESVNDLSFSREINELGEEGWELVFARRASAGLDTPGAKPEFAYEMIFKRRR
jgi:hypothetical protein